MDDKKIALMKERIQEQINKIDNKDFTTYFYIIDTKGVQSGSLSYIYDIALSLKEMGYNVGMLHNEDEFVGVEEWLGKKYAELPHYNIEKNKVDISPSDLLFIPEMYSNVMTSTKNLPCQRIVILQSFDRLTEFIPFGVTLSDLGINRVITTSKGNENRIKKYFPNIKTNIIKPKISNVFNNTNKIKKLIVNVVTRNSSDVNKIVKPFFWQYPMYKWVAFRELNGLSREQFADALNEAAITVWVDNETNFGFTPLEVMKSGSILIGKVPEVIPDWMWSKEENVDDLTNAGIWVDDLTTLPNIIASVIRTWTLDSIPNELFEKSQELASEFTEGKQLQDIKDVIIDEIINERKQNYITTLESLNNTKKD